jgi:hypothetical protein
MPAVAAVGWAALTIGSVSANNVAKIAVPMTAHMTPYSMLLARGCREKSLFMYRRNMYS